MDYVEETPPNYYFETNPEVVRTRLEYSLPYLEVDIWILENAGKVSQRDLEAEFVV